MTGDVLPLARSLRTQLTWLVECPVGEIARACREVAAAGWTATEVAAWVEIRPLPPVIDRPSAFLAFRLKGATQLWATASDREAGAQAARNARATQSACEAKPSPLTALPSPPPAVAERLLDALAQGRRTAVAQQRLDGHQAAPEPEFVPLPLDVSAAELVHARSQPDWLAARSAFAAIGLKHPEI